MKRLVFTVICFFVAVTAVGQTDGDFQKWMQSIGANCGSLKKNLDARNGEAAAADANKLHADFQSVSAFFQTKNSKDAVNYATGAGDGFEKIAAQASAGKFEEASATFKTTTANCGGCHATHREKAADGTFKIKY